MLQNYGWQYEKLGILKLKPFNLLCCLFNFKIFIFSTICPILYIACYKHNHSFYLKRIK